MTPQERRRIEPSDILPYARYAAERDTRRRSLVSVKRNRRIAVGPFVTLHFENYDTMWLQVQEMLHIEKGGAGQLAGELEAYNPLIPQGEELIATMMIEIDDPGRRTRELYRLARIEECVFLELDGERIGAVPADYEDRTTPDGKTSSVHFLRFPFTRTQIGKFRGGDGRAVLAIGHANYGHMAEIPPEVRQELSKDFA